MFLTFYICVVYELNTYLIEETMNPSLTRDHFIAALLWLVLNCLVNDEANILNALSSLDLLFWKLCGYN